MSRYKIEGLYWKEWEWDGREFDTLEDAIALCLDSLAFYRGWRIYEGDKVVYSQWHWVRSKPPEIKLDNIRFRKIISQYREDRRKSILDTRNHLGGVVKSLYKVLRDIGTTEIA